MTAIAIDLDDTLNDFTETLRGGEFPYDPSYALPEETFHNFLEKVRTNTAEPGDLLSTKYGYFWSRIHEECHRRAKPRADGVEFMRWLRANGWRIVICTHRDLRRSQDGTRIWLKQNGIPFDHLFMALNKIVFCRAWGIEHLVDDDVFSIVHGEQHGVRVYYRIMEKHQSVSSGGARPFQSFEEVKRWIQK